jgi:hypothetical protein
MPDTNTPIQHGDDDADAIAVEARMRLALGRLGPQAASSPGRPSSRAGAAQTGPQRRSRFARDGEVLVEHVPAPNRTAGDAQRELAAERAARQVTEQAFTDAKATIASLQAALARSEQAIRAAPEAVEEREAAMGALRADLRRAAAERDAIQAAEADLMRQAKPRRVQASRKSQPPQPVRWWLASTKPRN